MNLHKIIDITEADFGCEEHLDGPHAVLVFEDGDRLEVSEMWIAEQGIKEGKYIWIREDGSYLKAVRVVGAIIEAEKKTGDKTEKMIFATQRGYGDFKDGWEFPSGKIEDGETPEEAIVREIKEELVLKEHEAAKWLTKATLDTVDWLPADITIIEKVRELL